MASVGMAKSGSQRSNHFRGGHGHADIPVSQPDETVEKRLLAKGLEA